MADGVTVTGLPDKLPGLQPKVKEPVPPLAVADNDEEPPLQIIAGVAETVKNAGGGLIVAVTFVRGLKQPPASQATKYEVVAERTGVV